MADLELTTSAVTPTDTVIDDLRDRLRQELHDEDAANYRWTDDVLDRHLQRAAGELSVVWPEEHSDTLTATPDSRELDIASLADLVAVAAVEWPTGEYPPAYVAFSVYLQTLTMLVDVAPAAADDVQVFWGSLHTLDASESTLPAQAEDVVVTGAAGFAALEWASFASNRANVSGPAAVSEYQTWGEAKLEDFRRQLVRLGREARVRASQLFKAAGESTSANVVRWEP